MKLCNVLTLCDSYFVEEKISIVITQLSRQSIIKLMKVYPHRYLTFLNFQICCHGNSNFTKKKAYSYFYKLIFFFTSILRSITYLLVLWFSTSFKYFATWQLTMLIKAMCLIGCDNQSEKDKKCIHNIIYEMLESRKFIYWQQSEVIKTYDGKFDKWTIWIEIKSQIISLFIRIRINCEYRYNQTLPSLLISFYNTNQLYRITLIVKPSLLRFITNSNAIDITFIASTSTSKFLSG